MSSPQHLEGTVRVADHSIAALLDDEGGPFFTVRVPDDVPLDGARFRFVHDGSCRPFAVRHLAKEECGPGAVEYRYVCQWVPDSRWQPDGSPTAG